MGFFENLKYGRKAAVITKTLSRKSDDELNNILYDLRVKYNIPDDVFITMNTCISLITTRKTIEKMGVKNDELLRGDGSDVGAV